MTWKPKTSRSNRLMPRFPSNQTDEGKLDLIDPPDLPQGRNTGFLNENEAEQLQKGEVASVLKITKDNHGNKKEMLIEYDAGNQRSLSCRIRIRS
jgi:hypothetical protein